MTIENYKFPLKAYGKSVKFIYALIISWLLSIQYVQGLDAIAGYT